MWNDEIKCLVKEKFRHEKGILYHKTNSKQSKFQKEGSRYKIGDKVKVRKDNSSGYFVLTLHLSDGRIKVVKVHRIVWFLEHGTLPKFIDHIDRNRENNDPPNLREVTRQQNIHNTGKTTVRMCSSRYKGVFIDKTCRRKKWVAQISHNGNQRKLGYFYSESEAALAYNKAAMELFGEYACINVID